MRCDVKITVKPKKTRKNIVMFNSYFALHNFWSKWLLQIYGEIVRRYDVKSELRHKRYIKLCKIWGFHGGDYEEWRLLRCYAVWLL
jgi:hypothetical protein